MLMNFFLFLKVSFRFWKWKSVKQILNFEYWTARNILCPEWLFNTVQSRSLDDGVWTHATFMKYWNGVILTS